MFSKGPQQFWLHMDDEADAVIDITSQVVEYCQSGAAKQTSRPKVGQLVAALYSADNSWYRATVIEVKGDKLQVSQYTDCLFLCLITNCCNHCCKLGWSALCSSCDSSDIYT